jgi:hypothetical protein
VCGGRLPRSLLRVVCSHCHKAIATTLGGSRLACEGEPDAGS